MTKFLKEKMPKFQAFLTTLENFLAKTLDMSTPDPSGFVNYLENVLRLLEHQFCGPFWAFFPPPHIQYNIRPYRTLLGFTGYGIVVVAFPVRLHPEHFVQFLDHRFGAQDEVV